MLLKYQSYLLLILYLLTLNVSSEEQFNSNNAQLCNTDNIEQHIEEKNIQRVDISINKYRKWVKNYLTFIKSENEIIGKEFKKKFKAKINVFFDNGLDCGFLAKVRISGDLRDHVESDEKSVKSAKQKDKNIRDTELEDLRLLISKQWGRRLVWRILEQTGMYRTSFTGNSTTFFNEGQRNIGLWLVDEVLLADAEMYLLMIKENNNKQGDQNA